MCSSFNIIAYQTDFESVIPMRRRDGSSKPPPILITFAQQHVRSAILRSKLKLADFETYSTVYVNLDELVETSRAKAVFRRIGYMARQDGKVVGIRDNSI